MNAFFIIPTPVKAGDSRAVHGPPAAREAARRAGRDRSPDGRPVAKRFVRSLGGPPRRPLRPQQAQGPGAGTALRHLDRADHARDRARPEAVAARPGRSLSSRSPPASSYAPRTMSGGCSTRPRRSRPARRSSARATSSASSGSSCATRTSRTSSRPCSLIASRAAGPRLRRAAARRRLPRSRARARSAASTGSTATSTGKFWPFVPTGKGQKRDNAAELELKAKLEGELPIEGDLTRWFGLFGAPI